MRLALLACLCLSVCSAAQGQVLGLGLDLGYSYRAPTSDDSATYLSFGILGSVQTPGSAGAYAQVRPEVGIGPPRGDFRRESVAGGQSVCRDTRTGRFASDADCTSIFGGVGAEAGGFVGPLNVGAGYRLGFAPQPYGVVSYRVARLGPSGILLRGEGGPRGGLVTIGIASPR